MNRWRIDVEYDGTDLVGWQLQAAGRSVQGELEAAIERLFGERVRVSGSGRTDAGVHAEQQVASFTALGERSERAVRDGLNAYLPPDIAVIAAQRVPDDFDPRRSARVKRYRYQWLDRPTRSPLLRNRAWQVRRRLDVAAMHAAAGQLVGTHDFAAFRAEGCSAATTVRTMQAARVDRDGDLVCFRIDGNGFLRHMVRILAGSLVAIGEGTRDAAWLSRALVSADRDAAGRTAPAHGLTLEWVAYEGAEAPSS